MVPVLGFTVVLAALLTCAVAVRVTRRRRAHAGAAQRGAACRPVRAHSRRQVPHLRRRQHGGVRAGRGTDGTLTRVFVERDRGDKLEIALAQRATHAYSEDGDLQVITLYDGERFEGIPGERRFRIVRFAENTIPVRLPALGGRRGGARGRAHARSCCDRRAGTQRAEFHWRIALPVMAVVLAVIAVPLARLRPRQGRYARVGYAVLIFFVYISLTIAGKQWLERGVLPRVVRAVVGARRGGVARGRASCSCRAGCARARYRRNMAAPAGRGGAGMNLLDRYVIRAHAGRRDRRDGRAADARRAVPVRQPAGRHRRRHLHRAGRVLVRGAEHAAAALRAHADRRAHRCTAGAGHAGARQRAHGDARGRHLRVADCRLGAHGGHCCW